MHRHGYQGRKLGRESDQRKALIKSLADSLVIHESIETTVSKAKEIVPYMEKLITKAKKGDLSSRRAVIAGLMTVESAHKLVDDIAPKLSGRSSGHLRIKETRLRRGDNTQLARVSFVDDLTKSTHKPVDKPVAKTSAKKPASAKKPTVKKKAEVAK